MSGWLWWVIAACAFGIGELLTIRFILAPLALGAAAAAVFDVTGAGALLSWLAFIAVSLLSVIVVRPVVVSRRRTEQEPPTGAAALVGKQAIVLETISNHEGVGCVKVDGEVWTARAFDHAQVIERGTKVEVVDIKGTTTLVME